MEEKKELYQNNNGKWCLYPYLITCTDKGIQEEKYTDDIAHFEAFEELYDNFVINEVTAIDYSAEQLSRLNEIQGFKYKDFDEIYDYVMHGTIKIDSKIFSSKILDRNRADIDYMSIMLGVEL